MKSSIALFLLSLFAFTLQAQTSLPHLSSEAQKNLLGEVDQLVQKHFYDKTQLQRIKWHDQLGKTQAQIKVSSDLVTFTSLLNSLVAKLDTANTAIFSAFESEYWILKSLFAEKQSLIPYYQVWLGQSGAKVFLNDVTGLSLQRGDVISTPKMDPLAPLAALVDKPANLSPASSHHPDKWPFKKRLSIKTIASPSAKPESTTLTLQMKTYDDILLSEQSQHHRLIQHDKQSIGYMRLYAGHSKALLDHYIKTIDEFHRNKVGTVILDLRFGLGGVSSQALMPLLQPLNKRPSDKTSYKPKFKLYVLVNQLTTGGKEVFASQLQSELGAVVIGEKTLGAQTINHFYVLSDKRLGLYLPVSKPEGLSRKLWNKGITPQIPVKDIALFSDGQDKLLHAAMRSLSSP